MTLIVAVVWWYEFGLKEAFLAYWQNRRMPGVREKFIEVRNDIRNVAGLAYIAYCPIFLASPLQATLGKFLVGIKVISTTTNGRVSFFQALFRTALMLPASLGSRDILQSHTSQAWHDKIAKTRVVHRRRN